MEIYLVRHGEVEKHFQERFYGGSEVDLSANGQTQARAAGKVLASTSLAAIYCSPLSRAGFGASEVARWQDGVTPIKVDGLKEIDRGRWTGMLKSEVLGEWPEDLVGHASDLESWRGHGGESLGDLRDRVWRVFERLRSAHQPGDAIAIVAHLFPISAILAWPERVSLEGWRQWNIPTGSISKLAWDGDSFQPSFVGRI